MNKKISVMALMICLVHVTAAQAFFSTIMGTCSIFAGLLFGNKAHQEYKAIHSDPLSIDSGSINDPVSMPYKQPPVRPVAGQSGLQEDVVDVMSSVATQAQNICNTPEAQEILQKTRSKALEVADNLEVKKNVKWAAYGTTAVVLTAWGISAIIKK
jgi:hypothetical protein